MKVYIFNPITLERKWVERKNILKWTGINNSSITRAMQMHYKILSLNIYIFREKPKHNLLRELMAKEVIEDEYWKVIPEYSRYMISNYGRVKDSKFNIFLIPTIRKQGLYIQLFKDGTNYRSPRKVSSLMGITYLNKKPYQCITHKTNKYDNYVGNLELVDRKDLGIVIKRSKLQRIPILKIERKSGEIVNSYSSIKEAAKDNYISKSTISKWIKKKNGQSILTEYEFKIDEEFKEVI